VLLVSACDFSRSINENPRAARLVTDTLWGWHCDDAFFYAKARPGEYPDLRPPAPPVLGEVLERDTVILFISTNCPFPEAQTSKKVKESLETGGL
jgi:hypothetical protein